ncbi:MAG: hypothetical protein COA78_33830 [Blastopirellula sp.]|nr:MAG: hypothetical protein COA78_33830 [Blastopirellula sp.]
MFKNLLVPCAALAMAVTSIGSLHAVDSTIYLEPGSVELQSAGPLAFTDDGVLLVGDPKAATVYAIATAGGEATKADRNINDLTGKISAAIGEAADSIKIVDMAVNPKTGIIYLSGTSGTQAGLVSIDGDGVIKPVSLRKVKFAKAILPNAPADAVTGEGRRKKNKRTESITDIAYTDGKVIVTGLTAADASSTIHSFPFPFTELETGTPIEIYHGAHGRVESTSAIRSFVPFNIGGEPHLLAGFTCTPLVKFPLKDLTAGKKYRGTTVAELGNRNRPLDMIVYNKDGKDYVLMANSSRGVMKIGTDNIETNAGINEKISGLAGQGYETVKELTNVVQLAKLNDTTAVIITQADSGELNLSTVALP